MKTKYYVCGLGYDKNEHLNGYEQDFGVFNTYVEAYEFFVKLQCKGANVLFTKTPETYRLVIQIEECEETEKDGLHCLKIHNRWSFVNPIKERKEKLNISWKNELNKLMEEEISDSKIEDFIELHSKTNPKEIWDYVYEHNAPEQCKGCRFIQKSDTMPCIRCSRRIKVKDYYEIR